MILAIVGSRERGKPADKALIAKRVAELRKVFAVEMIITGGTQRGPEAFAKEIAEEQGIEYMEICPWDRVFKLNKPRTRGQEIDARDLRRAVVAMHADYMLCLIHPGGKHGEIISAYYFMRYHDEIKRYTHLELL